MNLIEKMVSRDHGYRITVQSINRFSDRTHGRLNNSLRFYRGIMYIENGRLTQSIPLMVELTLITYMR